MDEKEKLAFTIKTLEDEIPIYLESNNEYNFDVNFWMDKVVSRSNYEGIIEANLDDAYKAALKLVARNKFV